MSYVSLQMLGFLLAAMAVMWNDSIQTLGTYISSNRGAVRWQTLWVGASLVLVCVLTYGWYMNGGDISYGRLNRIPYQEVQWFHVVAPSFLLLVTWIGIPVSTSFLVLAAFSSGVVLESMLWKSFGGLVAGASSAFLLWLILAWLVRLVRVPMELSPRGDAIARVAQACSTALLWAMWLMQDMSNIAVYLPRDMPIETLAIVLSVLVGGLGLVFWRNGGKIQHIVRSKTNTRFVISATLVDLVYALVLYYFKILSDIPMSTTWVFVGILAGREAAIRMVLPTKKARKILPMLVADVSKLVFGATASVGIAFAIHNRWQEIVEVFKVYPILWFAVITATLIALWANFAHHVTDARSTDETPKTDKTIP